MFRTLARIIVWLLLAFDGVMALVTIAIKPADPGGWIALAIIYMPIGGGLFWASRLLRRRTVAAEQTSAYFESLEPLPAMAGGAYAAGPVFSSRPVNFAATYRPGRGRPRNLAARLGALGAGVAIFGVIIGIGVFQSQRNAEARQRGTPAAQAIIAKLAAAKIARASLPAGFTNARSDALPVLTQSLRDNHALAGSEIYMDGPDDMNYVRYYAFGSTSDAKDFASSVLTPYDNTKVGNKFTPSGLQEPAHCAEISGVYQNNAHYTGTTCFTTIGTVRISGTALSAGNDPRRNDAIALLKLGLANYQSVTGTQPTV